MRVLQLPSWYIPEGGMFCTEQSIALKQAGVEVHILANVALPWRKYKSRIYSFPRKPFFTEENGITLLRYYAKRIPFADMWNMKLWVRNTLRLYDMYFEKFGHPDIIHTHRSMWAGYAAALIKQRYGVPYVITEHRGRFSENSIESDELFPLSYHPFLYQAFENAHSIIIVSEQLRKKVALYAGENVPIYTISNVVNTDFYTEKKEQNPIRPFTFINANSYHFAKAYDILLDAFEKVYAQYPETTLLLLGNGFDDAQFVVQLNKLRSKNKIEFKGYQPPEGVLHYLHKSDSFVLSSRIEAQPVAILEAMSCGLPIVCTEVVPSEIVIPTIGVRCKTDNADALAEAMIYMIEHHASFSSTDIRQFAVSVCSQKAVASQILAVYKQIIHG